MPFKPGQSGNPGGKRRDRGSLIEALRLELKAKGPEGRVNERVIAEKLVEMARNGDLGAVKEVFDRVYGKPTQAHEHMGEGGGPLGLELVFVRAVKEEQDDDDREAP